MAKIVLELENEKDIRLFIDLAERLNIKFKAERTDKDLLNEEERQHRINKLQKFRGSLKQFKGYEPLKSEFYEQ